MTIQAACHGGGTHVPDHSTIPSDHLIQRALVVYERIFRAAFPSPSTLQLGRFAAGARTLEARRCAEPWPVPVAVQHDASFVLHAFQYADDVAIDEWLDLFPGAFLATLDRRRPSGRDLGPLMRRVVALHVCAAPGEHREGR